MSIVKMKDSGIDWIGKIPDHWGLTKFNTRLKQKIKDGPHETPNYVADESGVPFLTIGDLKSNKINLLNVKNKISHDDYNEFKKKISFKVGDLIFSKAATIGKVAIVEDKNFMIWSTFAVLRFKEEICNNFMFYLLQSSAFINYAIKNCTQNTQNNLGMEKLSKMVFPFTNLAEQQKIANFLDIETSKIDKEIELLEKKVELLNEYQQSLIFETVTKGLDKNVKMKDSGIEWIGEIPKHWEVKRLKDIYLYKNGYAFSEEDITTEFNGNYLIKITNITESGVKPDDNKCVNYSKKINGFRVSNNSILIALSGATAGKSCYVDICENRFYLNQRVAELKSKKIMCKYMFYILKSRLFTYNIINLRPVTAQPNIGKEDLDNYSIGVTFNTKEQKKIVSFLESSCENINKKTELINKKISLLKEYKQSLIYEAVTGKLEIN